MIYDDTTPIAALTVGQLKQLIQEQTASTQTRQESSTPQHFVYGIRGIERLFNVSHKTAQDYKNTFLKPAVMQCGRKIVVDADLALQLFNDRRNDL